MINPLSILIYTSLRIYRVSTEISLNYRWQKKIKKLLKAKKTSNLEKAQIVAIKNFYAKKNIKNIKTYWHAFYSSCNGYFSPGYVPENLYYTKLEPKLNNRDSASVLMDKNLLEKLFPEAKQPQTIVKNINGFYFNNKGKLIPHKKIRTILENYITIVIKPTIETGGGKNVSVLNLKDSPQILDDHKLYKLLESYKKNFIIQQKVEQHEIMAKLNPTSLNTFRIMSYLKDNKVSILSTIVRMGLKGSITDNSTTGGISCGVKSDGLLNKVGFQLTGEQFYSTSTDLSFEEIRIPFLNKLQTTVEELHIQIPYFKLVSWDLAIDREENVILIEINIKGQDITFHQLNNGPVLTSLLDDAAFN